MQVESQVHFCLINTDEIQVDHAVDGTILDFTLDVIENDFPIEYIEDQKKEERSDVDIALSECEKYITNQVVD